MIRHFNSTDLTGDEIKNLIGKPPVMYSDLSKYKTLEQLLGKEKYVVLLYQTSSKTNGHFVAITQYDDGTISWRESYGYSPVQVKDLCPYDDAFPSYVINLLSKYQVEYNTFDFQSKHKGISTCGRWASIMCRFRSIPLRDIVRLISTNKSDFLGNYDNVATMLTLLGLNDIPKYLEGPRQPPGSVSYT